MHSGTNNRSFAAFVHFNFWLEEDQISSIEKKKHVGSVELHLLLDLFFIFPPPGRIYSIMVL